MNVETSEIFFDDVHFLSDFIAKPFRRTQFLFMFILRSIATRKEKNQLTTEEEEEEKKTEYNSIYKFHSGR